ASSEERVRCCCLVRRLHSSVKARSLSGVSLLEFFWLGAFVSVFVAMCLELLANATLYNALLSCLPPLPSPSRDSQWALNDLRSLASGSADISISPSSDSPLFHPPPADPLSPSAPSSSLFLSLLQFLPSWTPAPLLAPLSLPFYFPLFESKAAPGCLRHPSLQSDSSAALHSSSSSSVLSASAFSASSLVSASPLSAFSFLPDHSGERWQRLLSTLNGRHAHGALPTLGCSLSLVAFMIFCVGFVEEFAKLVVLQRLQVLPVPLPLAWGGAEEASSERRNALEQRTVGGCCRPFWTRYVKHPVGVCLAGCAAGAGFAVAENLSYTLGRRGIFAEHLIVAIVRTFTAVPSHIANTGMAAANLALAWHAACALPAASPFFSSHLEAHQQPLIPGSSRASGHALPSFWRCLLPSLLVPSLLHGTYDAALRLSAAYAQPGPAVDDNAAVVAAVFLLVSFLAWLLTLLLFWQKWRRVCDLPAFGGSCASAFGPTAPELRRVHPQASGWDSRAQWVSPQASQAPETGGDDLLAGSAAQSAPLFCSPSPQGFAPYAVVPAFPFATLAAGTGETGVRADVLVWEERRREANRRIQQHANSLHATAPTQFSPAPAAVPRAEKPTGEWASLAQR
ncbi:protease prsW family protein, partial [Toxoplasma gondii FOU]